MQMKIGNYSYFFVCVCVCVCVLRNSAKKNKKLANITSLAEHIYALRQT